jgi:hypothetical protein
LKELRVLRESNSKYDNDKYFLLSLLPLMKKSSPEENVMLHIERAELNVKIIPGSPFYSAFHIQLWFS